MHSKVMLITGASRGIGAATARRAAARGYAVCINFRQQQDAATQLVAEIRADGGEAFAIQADISDENQVAELFKQFDQQFSRLDVLVNNAGMLESQSRLEAIDGARLQRVFAANVYGSFYCARQAIQRMSTRRGGNGGAIINLSSIAAKLGAPEEYIDYAAAKGAIDSMTVGLAKELAADGIKAFVNRKTVFIA